MSISDLVSNISLHEITLYSLPLALSFSSSGLSTLYGDVVGGKSEQRLQTKAEYKRYLERQMREKEQRRNIERGDRIKEEKVSGNDEEEYHERIKILICF